MNLRFRLEFHPVLKYTRDFAPAIPFRLFLQKIFIFYLPDVDISNINEMISRNFPVTIRPSSTTTRSRTR